MLGAGDATIFVSVIRLVTLWFLVRQAPMVTQLTGQVGQVGAIIAAAPLAFALHQLGWTKTFALASSLGIVLMVAVALLVKDSPYRREGPVRIKMRALRRTLSLVWGNPGTRLGMWSHFTSQFSATVFALLWGYPFLVQGRGPVGWRGQHPADGDDRLGHRQRARPRRAGGSRYPFYRSWFVLVIVAAMALGWAVVLARSTPAPMWMLVVLVCLMATGGPASMVGFDLARTFIPKEASGRANGFVNVGGFSASLLTMALIGVLLDWTQRRWRRPRRTTWPTSGSRCRCSSLFWGFGGVQILRYRHKAIAHLHRVHPGVVESMKRGEAFAHLGFHEREGV